MGAALNVLYGLMIATVVAVALLFIGTRIDLLGYQVKVVQSGSMEPAIGVGSIVIIAPAMRYEIGDVITFGEDTPTKVPITHRIVAQKVDNGETVFVTKGDANEDVDPITIARTDIIGKVWTTVPWVGRVIEFVRTPLGYGLLVGIPALIIILDEIADIVWEIHKYRARKRAGKVGYRVPSRERTPRPRPVVKQEVLPAAELRPVAPIRRGYELDLRPFRDAFPF